MHVPQLDLQAQYRSLQPMMDDAISRVLASGHFILGPEVGALERETAAYVGAAHGVGVASGTDALWLALRALDIGPGDEVIVPAFTFWATASVVLLSGATPVLVDIDPATYCIDPVQAEAAVTPQTKAIIPVHLFGHPAPMDAIMGIARRYGLRVIEDAAQAIGAADGGQRVGAIGDIGCLSFYPTKNLGAYGDGGMVLTSDDEIARRVRMLRTHGWQQKYAPELLGQNSRLDELQAAILRVKLPHLDTWNDSRRRVAAAYDSRIDSPHVVRPTARPAVRHVYHLYVVEVDDRSRVAAELSKGGVDTAVYYPLALHQTPVWDRLGIPRGQYPVSEAAARRCLALPMYPEITEAQVTHVATALAAAVS